jgi:hypothetical protein
MAEARTRGARVWLFRAPESAGAIYGTIAAMAVIAGTARSAEHGEALWLTVATLFVFWLAHVYAHALAHHLRGARRLDWSVVRGAMVEEWSLLQGPAPLLLLLVLGELGILEERQAVRLALWLGVVELVTWATLYARRQRWSWFTALTAGAVNGLFGLVIVVLEVVVH